MEHINRSFMTFIKSFFRPVLESPGMFIRGAIFPIVASMLIVYSVSITKDIIELVQGGSIAEAYSKLWLFIILIGAYSVARLLGLKYGHTEIWPVCGEYLSNKLLTEFVGLDNNKTERLGTGRLVTVMEKGIRTRTEMLAGVMVDGMGRLTKIIMSLVVVFAINRHYGILLLGVVVVVLVVHIISQAQANLARRARKSVYVEYMRDFVRIIMSKFEVLQANKLSNDFERWKPIFNVRRACNLRVEKMRFIGDTTAKLLIDGLKVVAIIAVLGGFVGGGISIAEFLALMTILVILDEVTNDLARMYIELTKQYVHVEKLRDVFELSGQMQGYESGSKFIYTQGKIEVQNLAFTYDDETRVFSDLSCTIQGGKKTALVGMSGGGKSTLIKLIAGYMRPDQGSVIVDGQDLQHVALKTYYPHIGYLTQEPSIFDGTIYENLAYAIRGRVDTEQIWNILKQAKCDFVADMKQGLETEIGERGIRLSGGQRQRLAIAKIMLKNPEIILLDEPTSALDSFSEEAVTQAMNNLFEGRTVVIIAHRLQTVKNADNIIVLDKGKVIERGAHKELVKLQGHYAQMLELQSGF